MSLDSPARRPSWLIRPRRFLYGLTFRLWRYLAFPPAPRSPSRLLRDLAHDRARNRALPRAMTPTGGSCHVKTTPERPL
jgi:hypothetical protein